MVCCCTRAALPPACRIASLALLITLDVVLRNLGITNFPWLLEVSEYVIYAATFLGGALGIVSRQPCQSGRSDHDPAEDGWPQWPASLPSCLASATAAVLAWYGLRVTLDTFSRGDILYKELVIPEWPLLAVIPIAGFLLIVEFARRAWSAARGPRSRRSFAVAVRRSVR